MEDAMASAERGAEGLVVQDVGAAEGEPLPGPLQRKQVRVLAVSWARAGIQGENLAALF